MIGYNHPHVAPGRQLYNVADEQQLQVNIIKQLSRNAVAV